MSEFNLKKAVNQINDHCLQGAGIYCDMPEQGCIRMFGARCAIYYPEKMGHEGWLECWDGFNWIRVPNNSTFRRGSGGGPVWVSRRA